MTGKDELINFKKMWTWLCCHPAHDREYYMKHVVKLEGEWINSCPLSNSTTDRNCTGCSMLRGGENKTLCSDPLSPVNQWMRTERQYPHYRSYYASQAAVLALKYLRANYPAAA